MKSILSTICFLMMVVGLTLLPGRSQAQTETCWEHYFAKGKSEFSRRNYPTARDRFEAALECPDVPSEEKEAIKEEIAKAEKALQEERERAEEDAQQARYASLLQYLQTEAVKDPTLAANILWETVQQEEDASIKSLFYQWYSQNSLYQHAYEFQEENGEKEQVLAIDVNGNIMAVSTVNLKTGMGKVWLVNLKQRLVIPHLEEAGSLFQTVKIDDSGNILYVGGRTQQRQKIIQIDLTTGTTGPLGIKGIEKDDVVSCLGFVDNDERNLLFIGKEDGSFLMFDRDEARVVMEVDEAHGDKINSVDFYNTGGGGVIILTAGQDGEAKLWQLSVGVSERADNYLQKYGDKDNQHGVDERLGHAHFAAFWELAPDDVRVVTGSCGKSILIYENFRTNTRQNGPPRLVKTLRGHPEAITALTVSPNDQHLASGSRDGTVNVWDTDGDPVFRMTTHQSIIWDLRFDDEGDRLATGSLDGRAILWDMAVNQKGLYRGGSLRKDWKAHPRAISPNGRYIWLGDHLYDLGLGLLNEESRREVWHMDSALPLAVDDSGDYFLMQDEKDPSTLLLWGAGEHALNQYAAHEETATAFTLSWADTLVVTGDGAGILRFWDATAPRPYFSKAAHPGGVRAVAIAPGAAFILSAGEDRTIKVWDREGELVATLTGHQKPVNDLVVHPAGDRFLSAADDKTARLWERTARGWRETRQLEGHTDVVNSVRFSADGRFVLTGSNDQTARLWDEDGILIRIFDRYPDPVRIASFTPEDEFIFLLYEDYRVEIYKSFPYYPQVTEEEKVFFRAKNLIQMAESGLEIPLETFLAEESPDTLLTYAEFFYDRGVNAISKEEKWEYFRGAVQLFGKVSREKMNPQHYLHLADSYDELGGRVPSWLLDPADHNLRFQLGELYFEKGKTDTEYREGSWGRAQLLLEGQEGSENLSDQRIRYLLEIYEHFGIRRSVEDIREMAGDNELLTAADYLVEKAYEIQAPESDEKAAYLKLAFDLLKTLPDYERRAGYLALMLSINYALEQTGAVGALLKSARIEDIEGSIYYLMNKMKEYEGPEEEIKLEYLNLILYEIEELEKGDRVDVNGLFEGELNNENVLDLYATLARGYLLAGNQKEAARTVFRGNRRVEGPVPEQVDFRVVAGYIYLLEGRLEQAFKLLIPLREEPKFSEEGTLTEYWKVFVADFNEWQERGIIPRERQRDVNLMREYLVFGQPVEELLAASEQDDVILDNSITFYQNLVTGSESPGLKSEYQQRVVELLHRLNRLPGIAEAKMAPRLSVAYGNLAYYYALSNEPDRAISAASRGLEYDESQEWIKTNLFLGLLLKGGETEYRQAVRILEELKDRPYEMESYTYREVLLSDLLELERSVGDHPHIERARSLLW